MKVREGFVSNSSSASFVILKKHISAEQLAQLLQFHGDGWDICENEDTVHGFTDMDNGELRNFMWERGILHSVVDWEDNS